MDLKEARFDRMSSEFHKRVHKAFATQLEDAFRCTTINRNFIQVNASDSIEGVHDVIKRELQEFLERAKAPGVAELAG